MATNGGVALAGALLGATGVAIAVGVITLVLIVSGFQASGTGPQMWVVLAAGLAIGLGTYSGGWRIMRTMGKGIVEIETPQGAASGAATTATTATRDERQDPQGQCRRAGDGRVSSA